MLKKTAEPTIKEVGIVERINHSLIQVHGLPHSFIGEIVTFEGNGLGQVLSLNENGVEVMAFSKKPVEIGSTVTRTEERLQVRLSPKLLGTVVDPVCQNLLEKCEPEKDFELREIDVAPPPLTARSRIKQQLPTGVSLVDLILPLGKGQRELVLGNRKTGKTAFLMHAIAAQTQPDDVVVYAAIGKKMSEVKAVFELLQAEKLMNRVVIVASTANDPVSVISITPFTAMTVAEYFRDQGKQVLLILDDLSSHARYYRELALLGRRFPGKDSYPGDIFYTYARLLERGGNFVCDKAVNKTASITCLPVAETTDSDLTRYIISNLISITDGHLLFDTALFSRGQRPAIDIGLSVTRSGRQTQSHLEQELSNTLSTYLSQYNKTRGLIHFGAELNEKTRGLLLKGETLWEFLKQPKDRIYPKQIQVVMAAAIYVDVFQAMPPTSMPQARDNLTDAYEKTPQVQKDFAKILSSKSFADFQVAVTNYKQELLQLCKL